MGYSRRSIDRRNGKDAEEEQKKELGMNLGRP